MQSTNRQSCSNKVVLPLALFFGLLSQLPSVFAQDKPNALKAVADQLAGQPIEILEEPKTVDPATLLPPQLAIKVNVKFDGETLKSVFNWIQHESDLNVLVDYKSLAGVKLLDTEPIFEELVDAPLYLLLSRLETLGLGWYIQDDSLQITSREEYLKHDTTVPYNLGDLFDAGFSPADMLCTITRCTGGRWDGEGGVTEGGTAVLLGDVVFVRQTDGIHREVAGLLAAIRKHGRRTFTLDSPRHDALRTAVNQKVTIDFQETPLIVAAQELSRQAQIGIRLDRTALTKSSVRERIPVSLKMNDQRLTSVLKSLLTNLELTWYLRDDVLWITTAEGANQIRKSAVYDVRDLCRDADESIALKQAIQKQTRAKWRPGVDSGGIIEVPKPGILVARHTEGALDEVLRLLENYRTALRGSKLRSKATHDSAEVIFGYYRLPRPMAESLRMELPRLIFPETWKSSAFPKSIGEILEFAADAKGGVVSNPANKLESNVIVSENVVLVIRQSRAVHQEIGKLIQTLMKSQPVDPDATIDTAQKPHPPGSFGSSLIPSTAK